MPTRIYKEYLMYLFGELTESHSEKYPNTRYWKNDEYGVVLQLEKSGILYIHYKIWTNFSMFFSLQYNETQQVMKDVLEEHLKLGGITPPVLLFLCLAALEEHLKLGGITPYDVLITVTDLLEEHLKLGVITPVMTEVPDAIHWKSI